jgi:hypothetical protein
VSLWRSSLDVLRAWVRYRGTRVCCSCLRWVGWYNRRTLTESEGAQIIELLRELKERRDAEERG